jgi:hypothetical protein
MTKIDPYAELGVPKNATQAQIRRARKIKAMKLHPDRKGGDPEGMARCNLAHDILIDPQRRAKWDRGEGTAPEDSDEKLAQKVLVDGFNQVWTLSLDSNVPVNIPRTVEKGIKQGVDNIQPKINQMEDELDAMRSYLGEVETDDPLDLFTAVIQTNIAGCEAQLANAQRDVRVGLLAIEMIKRYRSGIVELSPGSQSWYQSANAGPRRSRYRKNRKRYR